MKCLKMYWESFFKKDDTVNEWWHRKLTLLQKRQAKILHIKGHGKVYRSIAVNELYTYEYILYLSFLIQDGSQSFINESLIKTYSVKDAFSEFSHQQITTPLDECKTSQDNQFSQLLLNHQFYSRLAAVRYAENWWRSFNPLFSHWRQNSLSFIFQCIYAGFQQSVIYEQPKKIFVTTQPLTSSLNQISAKEVHSVDELRLGDIILYDFSGKDEWNYGAIVTAKDSENNPLVNSYKPCSRHRYWTFEDSLLWSQETNYKFLQID